MLERVLVIAPHPDDDAIACGALLQRAGAVRILFVTDGERNPWPQRFKLRKLVIDANDRARWGAMRRVEALTSLARLGVGEESARFLGFPDQKLMSLARRGDGALREIIAEEIERFAPTLVASPSSFDAHYDHCAIAWYVHGAATDVVTYVVHGEGPRERIAFTLELTEQEEARKLFAIHSHESQLLLSRDRFLSYATNRETFYRAEHDLVRVESSIEALIRRARHAWFTCTGRR